MLEAIGDPAHERHAELAGWIEPGFDPTTVDSAALAADVAGLAAQWSRVPATKRKKKA